MTSLINPSALASIVILTATSASAATSYYITLTNGSAMPISPAVVYVAPPGTGTRIGSFASNGLAALCETGNAQMRAAELQKQAGVTSVSTTSSPILPGETRTITVAVKDPQTQSIHIETMYGKSKDICGVAQVPSHTLVALEKHVTTSSLDHDFAMSTGRYGSPALDSDYLSTMSCSTSKSAVDCLRELSLPNMPVKKVSIFAGYLPSVLKLIEEKFGAAETQSLLISSSSGISVETKLKH